jgi:putative oxidoreductase
MIGLPEKAILNWEAAMNSRTEKILGLILRWFLGSVFIYAAVGKIWNPAGFAEQIDNYRLLPWILVTCVAFILPWIELLSAIFLLIGRWLRGASLWMIAMNAVFILAITSAMWRGLDIDCGCFSLQAQASRVGFQRLVEDGIFLLAAMMIFWQACSLPDHGHKS